MSSNRSTWNQTGLKIIQIFLKQANVTLFDCTHNVSTGITNIFEFLYETVNI